MKSPVNCWEFFKCGREPGGDNASSLGICPTATQQQSDGIDKD
ncbi:MAG: two-CW domain-containing protein [Candidatus Sedimenticola sp. 20ELBAFRAG]